MLMMKALQADRRARRIFASYSMGCGMGYVGCMGTSMDTVEDGAKKHVIDSQAALADLNKLLVPAQASE